MTTLLHFTSQVNEAGYEWVPYDNWNLFNGRRCVLAGDTEPQIRPGRLPFNSIGKAPQLLLRAINAFPDAKEKTVQPTIEDPALFRNFSRLKNDLDVIAEFAGRYGNLWVTQSGVPFIEWEFEINAMRFVVDLWDAITNRDTDMLKEHFNAKGKDSYVFPCFGWMLNYAAYGGWPSSIDSIPDPRDQNKLIFPTVGRGSLLEVAREYILHALNAHLRAFARRVPIELVDVGNHLELTARPRYLLIALWLQFAEAFAAEKQYRQCESCSRYMELSPNLNRADRRYCSDACRSRALRQRQKLASQLRDTGKTLREIAKATGSDTATIKKWLSQKDND